MFLQELTAEEMNGGGTLSKLGFHSWDTAILPLYEALKNCEKVLYYRVDSGGIAASATLGKLDSHSKKYNGVRGNDLAVGIATVSNGFEVSTYLDGNLVHQQIVLSRGYTCCKRLGNFSIQWCFGGIGCYFSDWRCQRHCCIGELYCLSYSGQR